MLCNSVDRRAPRLRSGPGGRLRPVPDQPRQETPLERALWACLAEGLGNYRSLSPRWFEAGGGLSEHARDVLGRLEPIFVERLAALASATDANSDGLMQGLSMGPFEEKWGALPVALWLASETAEDPGALAAWIERGSRGVLVLARRHLPADLAARLPTLSPD